MVRSAKGRGRKFTLDILRTLLKDGPHVFADLDAGNMVQDTPVTFAQKLLVAVHADPSGLPPNESLTTDLNWIKFKLMPSVRNAIDAIRGNRTVWIAIRYPQKGVLLKGSKIREALDALYGQVLEAEWLRLLLVGLKIDVPNEVRAVTTVETLRPLTAEPRKPENDSDPHA